MSYGSAFPVKDKKPICRQFLADLCRRGDGCKFYHPPKDTKAKKPATAGASAKPKPEPQGKGDKAATGKVAPKQEKTKARTGPKTEEAHTPCEAGTAVQPGPKIEFSEEELLDAGFDVAAKAATPKPLEVAQELRELAYALL